MHDLPRHTLCDLLAQYGPALCADPRRCEGLLRDFCGEQKREIFVLVSALRERVAVELQAAPAGVPHAVLLARLTQRLQANLALSEDAARWAVETWALALGVLAPANLGDRPPAPAAPLVGSRAPDTAAAPLAARGEDMALFPLYGVTLGETTERQLAQLGKRVPSKDIGKLYLAYEVNGFKFWSDDSGIAHAVYLWKDDQLPAPWRTLGFDWNLSYNEWMPLFSQLGYVLTIDEAPWIAHVGEEDYASFSATITVTKNSIMLTLFFQGSRGTGTTVDAQGTLDHIFIQHLEAISHKTRGGAMALFPLYGVTLGETTERQLAQLGSRSETINRKTGEPFNHYTINGLDVWYDDSGIAGAMYFHDSINNKLPEQWRTLGFDWNLSYNEWIILLKNLGYITSIDGFPNIGKIDEDDGFNATLVAINDSIRIRLYFSSRKRLTADAQATLFLIEVHTLGKREV